MVTAVKEEAQKVAAEAVETTAEVAGCKASHAALRADKMAAAAMVVAS
jgi:hypothetical protein